MDLKSQYEAYEKSKRISMIADRESAERMNIKIGDDYTIFPDPTNKEEAFERLNKYTGLMHLESLINVFKSSFQLNLRTLKDELKILTDFIDEADAIPTGDVFRNINVSSEKRFHYEYLKFKYGYYENENLHFNTSKFFSFDAVFVYGKYFLYKKWIEEQIKKLSPKNNFIIDAIQDHKNSLEFLKKINPAIEITIYERIRRELSTIHTIFSSQFTDKNNDFNNIMNEDGRICRVINIRSDRKLSLIEEYKKHYTNRFEKAKTRVVVKNELKDLYKIALIVTDFYNKHLTYLNPKIVELYEPFKTNPFHIVTDREFRTMIVLVVDYQIWNILYGHDENSNDHRTIFTIRDYNYVVQNSELAKFCYELINFINTFEIPELQFNEADKIVGLNDDLKVNVITRSENPEMFESVGTNEVDSESKKKPKIPEKWGALLYLIELAIKEETPPENLRGGLSKSEIINIGKERGYKTAQYFYIYVRDTNLEKPNAIATEFHKNWKQKIIEFSNNNPDIITFLSEK